MPVSVDDPKAEHALADRLTGPGLGDHEEDEVGQGGEQHIGRSEHRPHIVGRPTAREILHQAPIPPLCAVGAPEPGPRIAIRTGTATTAEDRDKDRDVDELGRDPAAMGAANQRHRGEVGLGECGGIAELPDRLCDGMASLEVVGDVASELHRDLGLERARGSFASTCWM